MGDKDYRGEIPVGLLTIPFGNQAEFPDIAKFAGEKGYKRLSIAAWPPPELSASQRTGEDAFVAAHCGDLKTFNQARASSMKGAMESAGVKPHSVAFFENMSTADLTTRKALHDTFRDVCKVGRMLGAPYVGTFPGRNERMGEDRALKFFINTVGPELQKIASGEGLKVYFENCPMEGLIGKKGKVIGNVAYCPANWRRIFDALDGWFMNPDPSHMIWQGIDYIKAIGEFSDRVVEVHAKDAYVLDPSNRPDETKGLKPMPFSDENYETGIVNDEHPIWEWGAGLYYHAVPGVGHVNWEAVANEMRKNGIAAKGVPLMVEVEDEAFGPRSAGDDNYGRAAFNVAIRTLQPYCAAQV
jgi:sugar phosphate isomerase/epimerase